uniref:Uncharacterized protein n=1 Tax=Brassica oleracea TaxID=3712 RepID=A0A3P6DF99_BRAOL|nr:unnamed protein product [Brassica oleracea]
MGKILFTKLTLLCFMEVVTNQEKSPKRSSDHSAIKRWQISSVDAYMYSSASFISFIILKYYKIISLLQLCQQTGELTDKPATKKRHFLSGEMTGKNRHSNDGIVEVFLA